MILSNRNGLKNTRNMLRVFGGLNETYSCTEAEYSAGINFSARNFPALSTRLPRRKLREEADLNGMYHLNGLLTVCGRDLVYTPDDADEMKVTLKDAVEDGRKTLVGIGTRILIFPDKLAFDTASRKVSALGAVWSGKNTSVEFAPCDAEGKVYEVTRFSIPQIEAISLRYRLYFALLITGSRKLPSRRSSYFFNMDNGMSSNFTFDGVPVLIR
mgnify:CR=1 FL=1